MTDAQLSSFGDFRLDDWVVQPRLNRISCDESTVTLEPKIMQVLVCLAQRAGDLVSRQDLIDTVWATEFIGEKVLTRAIAELRKAFGDDAKEPSFIETIHRGGYVLLVKPGAVTDEESSMRRTLSHYLLLEHLGAGGMGVVYRAEDTKLGREVALKFLPKALTSDPEARSRFIREARAASRLDHPNVCTIHEISETPDGQLFIVMAYYQGETLAARLTRGPLPVDEAVSCAIQIAEGLECAHREGIVHRDLKPANIMVDAEGGVTVLDFGLAKAFDPEASSPQSPESLAESPTVTADLTRGGVLLGTAAYMSPEQARGKTVDKRADIWAFGAVLYEMLTGARAFAGDGVTDILAGIVKDDPDWDALPKETPPPIRRLLRRCLTKDPRDRLHDIADGRIVLQGLSTEDHGEHEPVAVSPIRSGWRNWLPWGLTALLATLIVANLLRPNRTTTPATVSKVLVGVEPAEFLGFTPQPSYGGLTTTAMALSPDGKKLVYSAGDDTGSRLYIRAFNEIQGTAISGTEGAECPFFSPDGKWIGFWADGEIKKVRTDGGPPMPVCDTNFSYGASWAAQDTIYLGQFDGGILRVSADGGVPEEITELADGEFGHRHPQLLADGDSLLFTARTRDAGDWEGATIIAKSLKTGARKILVENGADARFAPTGNLVFVRLGSLMAVPFDHERLEVTGGAVVILESVRQSVNNVSIPFDSYSGQFAFSSSGTLVHVPGGVWSDETGSMIWVDRKGRIEKLPVPPGPYWTPSLSPDGSRVAVNAWGFDQMDIWVLNIATGAMSSATSEDSKESDPLWTPDGTRITFRSDRSGHESIYWIPADGSGEAEHLVSSEGVWAAPASWSPDGKVLAYLKDDIWMLSLGEEPRPFLESPFNERWATFSPDGRWLAYGSNRSGRMEVYVTPYPGPGPRVQISNGGGRSPAWSPNGRELFFVGLPQPDWTNTMWVVDIETGSEFSAGRPRELFTAIFQTNSPTRSYDISSDGQRFLMIQPDPRPEQPVTQMHVTFNWFEELNRLVPTE